MENTAGLNLVLLTVKFYKRWYIRNFVTVRKVFDRYGSSYETGKAGCYPGADSHGEK